MREDVLMNNGPWFPDLLQRIRDAYRNGRYQQLSLLSTGDFISYARRRGLLIHQDQLQGYRELVPAIDSVLGEDFYHPYQVWLVWRLQKFASMFHLEAFAGPSSEKRDQLLRMYHEARERSISDVQQDLGDFHRLVALCSMIEPYYLPYLRSTLRLPVGLPEDPYQQYWSWRGQFDAAAALKVAGLALDTLKHWHEGLSGDATILDPAETWYLVIRHAKFTRRESLRGDLRLAYDFYEIAELLRLAYHDVCGLWLPGEDDYFDASGGAWKTQAYGVKQIDFRQRLVLKRILRGFGLDPSYKGIWIVEGDTEVGFVREFAQLSGLNLESAGIALVNLGGAGNLATVRSRARKELRRTGFTDLLQRLRDDEVFVFATVDDDPGTKDALDGLSRRGLLTAGSRMWREFEEANFTATELVIVVRHSMSVEHDLGTQITETELSIECSKLDQSGRKKTLGAAVLDIASKKPGMEQAHKSEDWGAALARQAIAHPMIDGHLRPIIEAFRWAWKMSYVDFASTVQHAGQTGTL